MLPPPPFSRIRRPVLSLMPGTPPELWRYSRASLRQLLARARVNDVTILAWTINSDFSVSAYRWLAQQLYLNRALTAARLLQAPLLRVILGGSLETPYTRDRAIVRRLTKFVKHSQRRVPGMAITVENHWGISTDIDRHLRIYDLVVAQLPSSAKRLLGCCFDPSNMPDSSERERWWQELALRANHFHLKTKEFDDEELEKTLPHTYLFELLQSAGFTGRITIEYSGDGSASEGVKRSARLFYKQGAHLSRPR